MIHQLDDTIVAVSSAAGAGARGIIRLSGPRAVAATEGLFEPACGRPLSLTQGHRRVFGRLRVAAGSLPAEAYIFRAPASYTRQDIVELHTIGSPPLLSIVLEQLLGAGARAAEPGEFTARAFFNGALDLTRVEGVAAAIGARSDAQLRASQHLLHGGLSRRMGEVREELADLLALVEAEIDFVEESIGFVTIEQARSRIRQAAHDVATTLEHGISAERLELLPEVLLVGRPNAGKSTLFNRLTGTDRAIRSAVAGTTRDVLRAPMSLPGGDIMLCDSAGLFDSEGEPAGEQGTLDVLAQSITRRAAESADLLLLTLDASQQGAQEAEALRAGLPTRSLLIVANKVDLIEAGDPRRIHLERMGAISVSALTAEGFDVLLRVLGETLFSDSQQRGSEVLALTARQHQSLRDASGALLRAIELMQGTVAMNTCAELLAIELREAISALSLLTGELTTEDLLGRIFSRFCIGK